MSETKFNAVSGNSPMSDKTRDTLIERADAAFQQAAARVIERARQTGTPIIVWENCRIVK